MALINKLEAIGDAIRAKTGGTAELSLDDMVTEIEGISGGSGEKLDLVYNFLNGTVISDYTAPLLSYINSIVIQDTVTAYSIHNNLEHMIYLRTTAPTTLPPIILDIAYGNNGSLTLNFANCETVKSLDNITLSANFISTMATHEIHANSMFAFNYQLRETPDFLKYINHKYPYDMGNQIVYVKCCYCCYNLEKVVLPVGGYKPLFKNCFTNCFRLSSVKFRTEDNNLPVKLTWTWNNSTIDLTGIGYVGSNWVSTYTHYGDTTAQVTDSSSYQSLKNNPNWWTSDIAYSRYNHDSAVETINSLPDCSTVGTNTIKFIGNSGSATDGGAINTLTEEEIAVATAKGWTVTLS